MNESSANICQQHWPDLYFASFFLPSHKRVAVRAIASFCQMIREAIGEDPSRMALFSDRLDEIYESRSPSAHVIGEVISAIQQFEIPKQYFRDYADSCVAEATVKRYATWPSLEKYCHQSGGCAALMMSCVLGLTHSDASRHAAAMGTAIRLTQILRDIRSDWKQGRLYLPLEDLARFRYSQNDLAAARINGSFATLMKFEIERARQLYRDGSEGVCWLAGDGSRMMAATVAVIWSGLLDAIERKRFDVLSDRICMSWPQKLARLPRAWRLARRAAGERLPHLL